MSISDILSIDEVNTLLHEDGKKPQNPEQAAQDGVPLNFYDFISEYHKSVTKSRGFEVINQNVASELSDSLLTLLPKNISVDALEPEITTYEHSLKKTTQASTLSQFYINQARDLVLVRLEQSFLSTATNLLFSGQNAAPAPRPIGHVDVTLSKHLSTLLCGALKKAWQTVMIFHFDFVKTAPKTRLPSAINPSDKVIILPYALTLEGTRTRVECYLPYRVLNAASHKLNQEKSQNSTDEQTLWANALKTNTYNAPINLSAEITETQIKLKDVIHLKPGDVITINNPSTGYLLAEGMKLCKVKCGVHDGLKVVEIMDRIEN